MEVAFTCWLCTSCKSSSKKDGKKGGKNAEKEADIKAMSVVNSNVWQARLEVVEQSRIEYRCFGSLALFTFTFNFFSLGCVFFCNFCCKSDILLVISISFFYFLDYVLMLFRDGSGDHYITRLGHCV